jgi:hypothetical protein
VPRPNPDLLRLSAMMQQILIMHGHITEMTIHAELVYGDVLLGTTKVNGQDDRVIFFSGTNKTNWADWLDLINAGEGYWNTGDIDDQSEEPLLLAVDSRSRSKSNRSIQIWHRHQTKFRELEMDTPSGEIL